MDNPTVVYSSGNSFEAGKNTVYETYAEHTFRMLREAAKMDIKYLNLYKVVKKRRESMPKKGKKYSIRKIFTVVNVTDNSFTIN